MGKSPRISVPTLAAIPAQTRILLIYLQMDYEKVNSTSPLDNIAMHLRPLLGLQYLVAAARTVGMEAVILDRRIMVFDETDVLKVIERLDIQCVGFYTSFALTKTNLAFIRKLRAVSAVPIVVGGPGYRDHAGFLEAGANWVCKGEGEETFIEILRNLGRPQADWSQIKGLCYLQDGQTIETADRPLLDFDQLFWPVRDNFVPVECYTDYFMPGFRKPYITLTASRGCPYRCTYCDSHYLWRNKVRQRTPDHVLEEVDHAVKTWNIRYIDFLDDVFGLTYEWVEEFGSKLRERRYDLKYKFLVNPRTFGNKQRQAFAWCARSGGNVVGIGMQSADENTLLKLHRGADTPAKLKEAVANAKQHDICTFVSFILGFPYEPENAPATTIKLIKEAKPHLIDAYPLIYLTGTELEQSVRENPALDKYSYEDRRARAVKVKRSFYLSPANMFRILSWILRNNPSWLVYVLRQYRFFIEFVAGFKQKTADEQRTHP